MSRPAVGESMVLTIGGSKLIGGFPSETVSAAAAAAESLLKHEVVDLQV